MIHEQAPVDKLVLIYCSIVLCCTNRAPPAGAGIHDKSCSTVVARVLSTKLGPRKKKKGKWKWNPETCNLQYWNLLPGQDGENSAEIWEATGDGKFNGKWLEGVIMMMECERCEQ